jgi:hypothetical protein
MTLEFIILIGHESQEIGKKIEEGSQSLREGLQRFVKRLEKEGIS